MTGTASEQTWGLVDWADPTSLLVLADRLEDGGDGAGAADMRVLGRECLAHPALHRELVRCRGVAGLMAEQLKRGVGNPSKLLAMAARDGLFCDGYFMYAASAGELKQLARRARDATATPYQWRDSWPAQTGARLAVAGYRWWELDPDHGSDLRHFVTLRSGGKDYYVYAHRFGFLLRRFPGCTFHPSLDTGDRLRRHVAVALGGKVVGVVVESLP